MSVDTSTAAVKRMLADFRTGTIDSDMVPTILSLVEERDTLTAKVLRVIDEMRADNQRNWVATDRKQTTLLWLGKLEAALASPAQEPTP